ncbi:thermonuclease family protein [Pontixanthobacter gangjinensis]|uniref:Thermonuclease family protein n=1 Tax=Pontixanthobacter gangjinensis TaxID=1028742 RepID=A0A6I4SSC0_9SPHN|nr:thermonuclease family protein [Pontixanthobacter gangjinensis]MXO57857.1 thermonuclease family protein [Pontixanthobacter gangjinensis]
MTPQILLTVALGLSLGALVTLGTLNWKASQSRELADTFVCSPPSVVDGDTIRCGDQRIRLQGIDAPEMPGHCRTGRNCTPGDPFASTANLSRLVASGQLRCLPDGLDRYGRTLARCSVGEIDLSCAQIESGHAVRRYDRIWCDRS